MNKSFQVWGMMNGEVPRLLTLFWSREMCEEVCQKSNVIEFTLRPGPDPVPELVAALRELVEFQESTDLDDEPVDGEYGDGKRALMKARAVLAKHSQQTEKGA